MDPITILVGAAAVGAAASGGGLIAWAVKRWNAKLRKQWGEAARRVGGALVPPSGPWYHRRPMSIEAHLHDVGLLVDSYTVSTGNSSQTYTRCRARALGAGLLKLKVKRAGLASGLSRAIGFQDLATGDAQFDEQYVIKASDDDLALAWMDRQSREAVAPLQKYQLELKKGEVKAIRGGLDRDPDTLVLVMDAVASLAAGGRRVLERWRALAEELEGSLDADVVAWSPDADVRVEAPRRGARLVVDTTRTDDRAERLLTRLRCHLVAGTAEPLAITRGSLRGTELQRVELPPDRLPAGFKVASADAERAAGRLGEQLCRRLGDLPLHAVEAGDRTITVLLDGLVLDARVIGRAADLALDLASSFSGGVYR